jgi:predicted DNA-binding transcriptional regulator AlpA
MKFAAENIDESYAALSRDQVARALGLSLDTLDKLHQRGEGPPRFRASPRRWAYPAAEFRRWQQERTAAA